MLQLGRSGVGKGKNGGHSPTLEFLEGLGMILSVPSSLFGVVGSLLDGELEARVQCWTFPSAGDRGGEQRCPKRAGGPQCPGVTFLQVQQGEFVPRETRERVRNTPQPQILGRFALGRGSGCRGELKTHKDEALLIPNLIPARQGGRRGGSFPAEPRPQPAARRRCQRRWVGCEGKG